jgi:hypothetical protein
MSARDLRDWIPRRASELAGLGIAAVHGAGPRISDEGATWVSFSSRTGSGRLVRAADGSATWRADRYSDGRIILESRATATMEDQLDALMDALCWPASAVREIRR